MQWFEKIYKERFSSKNMEGYKSDLEGIDSSELWSQISKSIPQEEPNKNIILRWRSLGVLIFLSLFTAVLFIFTNNQSNINSSLENNTALYKQDHNTKTKDLIKSIKKQDSSTNEISLLKSNVQNSKSVNINKPEAVSITNNGTREIKPSASKPYNNRAQTSNINTKSINSNQEESKKTKHSKQKLTFENLGLNKNSTSSSIETSDQKRNQNLKDQKTEEMKDAMGEQTITSNNDKTNTSMGSTLEFISETSTLDSKAKINIEHLVRDWPQSPEREIKPLEVSPFTTLTKIHKSPSPWSIKFRTQINSFDQNYKEETGTENYANLANQSLDSIQYGHGFGVHLGYTLNSNWTVSTGLESNRYKNQLNTVTTTDTMVFDSLHQKYRNAKNIRIVKHTNKVSTITIPLNISYDYSLNQKFGIGTAIGLAYSIVTSQSGRLLGRTNTIIDFDSNDNKQFENYFSLRVNPYIRYRLNNNFDLSMEVGFSKQSHGTSVLVDLIHGSTILSIGLGLKYNFN